MQVKQVVQKTSSNIAVLLLVAVFMLAALSTLGFSTSAGIGTPDCSAKPYLSIAPTAPQGVTGQMVQIQATISSSVPSTCPAQKYGLDFTNIYDAGKFDLGIAGVNGRNVFTLGPLESKTFTAQIKIPQGTQTGDYHLQLLAYLESDHWDQNGVDFTLGVRPSADCITTPTLKLADLAISSTSGRTVETQATVTATQPAYCGPQVYGVDFTNGFDAGTFDLSMKGQNQRLLFTLNPGESRTFTGQIGIMPGTVSKNYNVQMTAYAEADHWKQANQKLSVDVLPIASGDAYWSTPIVVGWNTVPSAPGASIFGCPDVQTAYRYSPSISDYIQLVRDGDQFVPAPGQPDKMDEGFGALFLFSKKSCALQSSVPSSVYTDAKLTLTAGQLVAVPPAWDGVTKSSLQAACALQTTQTGTTSDGATGSANAKPSSGSVSTTSTLQVQFWDATMQHWQDAYDTYGRSGDVFFVKQGQCTLPLDHVPQKATN